MIKTIKHIRIKFHYIRQLTKNFEIEFDLVDRKSNYKYFYKNTKDGCI